MEKMTWRGLTAEYDDDENAQMAELRAADDVAALWLVHQLKATFPGSRLVESRAPRKPLRRLPAPAIEVERWPDPRDEGQQTSLFGVA